ncbi:hypothetical protein BGW80DRAFT_713106 [Lactifluus volemus]|nr:hypothetical protein BGW80DRAFT_713106 [Lactifluus volemus]
MTDWHDPALVATESFALVKLMHVLGGIYIWELLYNIDLEYSVITRKRRFTWAFPLYLGCRWCPLFAIVSQFLGFDTSNIIDCQAWVVATFMFGYFSFAFSSALIVLRVVALWDRNKVTTTLASVCWLATFVSYIYSGATARAIWDGDSCIVVNAEHTKIAVFSTFISDIALLFLMLIGLLRWKNCQRCGVWWFMCTQGSIWIVLLTLAEVPPVVLIILNLNDPLNLMFQVLALIIMAIGASRIYRGLTDHPALNRYSAKEVANIEWSKDLASKPIASHRYCLTEGTYSAGDTVTNTALFMTLESEVEKFEDGDIV